jgi:hypothetical protein
MSGPLTVAPGRCPGGIVVHIYDFNDALLLERTLATFDEADEAGGNDVEFVSLFTSQFVAVAYDGDTGERLTDRLFGLNVRGEWEASG